MIKTRGEGRGRRRGRGRGGGGGGGQEEGRESSALIGNYFKPSKELFIRKQMFSG